MRSQHRDEQSLLHVAHADDPCRHAIDAGIEEVETEQRAVEGVAAYDLAGDLGGFVVKADHMVAVPADAAGDVQSNGGVEEVHGGQLIRDDLGGVIVAVVHQRDDAAGGGVGHAELGRADRVGLKPDAEDLRFQRNV